MKGREVRELLTGKVDAKVVHVMAELAEQAQAQKQEISELAILIDRVTDLIMSLGATIESATNTVDEIQKMRNG